MQLCGPRSADFRRWRFTCLLRAFDRGRAPHASQRLPDAPDRLALCGRAHLCALCSQHARCGALPFGWRRFPYALTVVGRSPALRQGAVRARPRVEAALSYLRSDDSDAGVSPPRCAGGGAVRSVDRQLDEAPVPARRHRGDARSPPSGPALQGAHPARARHGHVLRARSPRRCAASTATPRTEATTSSSCRSSTGAVGPRVPRRGEGETRRGIAAPSRAIPRLPKGARPGSAFPSIPSLIETGGRLLVCAVARRLVSGPQLVADTSPTADAVPSSRGGPHIRRTRRSLGELVLRDRSRPRVPAGTSARGNAAGSSTWRRVDRRPVGRQRASIPVSWVVDAAAPRAATPTAGAKTLLGNVDYAKVRSRASSRRP